MYYEDDFYREPTEFEEQVEELKEALRNSVKKEIQDEMQQLRIENESLRSFKKQKEKIEQEHRSAMQQIECDKEKNKREIMRMRILELIGDLSCKAWFASDKRVDVPKCDACDKNRRIHYTTPSGKDATEECPVCGAYKYIFEPEEIEAYEFHQSKNGWGGEYPRVSVYYRRLKERDYDSFEKCRNVYDGRPFEEIDSYRLYFFDKEECQKYCDWKNSRSK